MFILCTGKTKPMRYCEQLKGPYQQWGVKAFPKYSSSKTAALSTVPGKRSQILPLADFSGENDLNKFHSTSGLGIFVVLINGLSFNL